MRVLSQQPKGKLHAQSRLVHDEGSHAGEEQATNQPHTSMHVLNPTSASTCYRSGSRRGKGKPASARAQGRAGSLDDTQGDYASAAYALGAAQQRGATRTTSKNSMTRKGSKRGKRGGRKGAGSRSRQAAPPPRNGGRGEAKKAWVDQMVANFSTGAGVMVSYT